MVDIYEYRNDLKIFLEKASSFFKEEKYNEAIQFYKQSITCLENLIKYDENLYNRPVYMDKKKEIEEKIQQLDLNHIKNKAKELETDAVQYDKLGDYEKAIDLYVRAANKLQLLIKIDLNPYNKKFYVEKAKSYLIRAKEIKVEELKYREKSEILNDKK